MKDFVERLQDILKTEPEDIIKVRNLLDKAKEENKRLREEIKNLEEMIEKSNCEVCIGYLITKKVVTLSVHKLTKFETIEPKS